MLWRAEFLNVLALAVRTGTLDEGSAQSAWAQASHLFTARERPVEGGAVLKTASRFGITAYDAQFVALAEALGVVLVTNDRRSLANRCPETAVVRLSSFATTS